MKIGNHNPSAECKLFSVGDLGDPSIQPLTCSTFMQSYR